MTSNTSTAVADRTRQAALEMLAEGLATMSEVARLAGVDRQLVRHWAMRANIDVSKARAARLRETWRSKIGKHQ
jgi:transposase-like protein